MQRLMYAARDTMSHGHMAVREKSSTAMMREFKN
jgi:hypothetical protein